MSLTVPTSTEFPTLAREGLVYLDTAATAQTVRPAIEAMDRYYQTYRASIHRGIYEIASEATDAYEAARVKVAAFTNSTPGETIFTKNVSEAINLVAYTWARQNIGEAMQPFGAGSQLAYRLRTAEHQRCQQRHGLRRHGKYALDIVRITHHSAPARFDDKRQRSQVIHACLYFALAGVEDRIAARLLVAARNQRIQRQRVRVGHRVLLLHQYTEHTRFEQRQRGQRRDHGLRL